MTHIIVCVIRAIATSGQFGQTEQRGFNFSQVLREALKEKLQA